MQTKHIHINTTYEDITAPKPGKNGFRKPIENSAMKIALLTDGIYPFVMGGMQKHSYYLAKYLAKNKVRVDLYHTVAPDNHIDYEGIFTLEELKFINPIQFEFPRLKYFPGHYLRESYIYSQQIYDHLVNNLDVVFIYAKGFTAWKLLNQKRRGYNFPPIGVNFHGYEMFQKAPSWKLKLQHYLLRPTVKAMITRADYVFSYGGKINKIIEGRGLQASHIIEIPTGIEKDWIITTARQPESRRKFVFIGRFERRKGIEEINSVLESLIETDDFEFHFIGAIPGDVRLRSRKCVYWNSITDEEQIKGILRGCDVLVCPSYSEGMPNVILEGMASGLAIIATNVGAVASIVSGKNGWLLDSGTPKRLKEAMLSAIHITDHTLLTKKNHSLNMVKKRYTWDVVIERTLTSIKNLLQK
ncbi:MAG: glycosyltransferase family 4 protein [Balneolales bacterium]